MEGCGIAAGDAFLKPELTEIMNSPAWRTQRSLAIITVDEDAADYQHPAQRVPTIVLASAGVKAGYSDPTHYSLLRTIEAAVGLGTLTANDRYAQPLNNIFIQNGPFSLPPVRPL
jgi:Phosphoesterase family